MPFVEYDACKDDKMFSGLNKTDVLQLEHKLCIFYPVLTTSNKKTYIDLFLMCAKHHWKNCVKNNGAHCDICKYLCKNVEQKFEIEERLNSLWQQTKLNRSMSA